jgi:SAM-dependent methyltransferase
LRNPTLDLSTGFNIDQDRTIAEKLVEISEITTTFNELLSSWNILSSLASKNESISKIDPQKFLFEYKIKPVHLSFTQLEHGSAILEKIPQYIKGKNKKMPTGIALEDGAGHGLFLNGFSSNFEHVYVLDLSLAYLVLAKKIIEERNLPNVTLICANAERLPFINDSFDFIHSNNVLEHVNDQVALVSEAKRTLKKDGLLFLLSPNRFSFYFEPHFRLPFYGFFPKPIRRLIISKLRNINIDDVNLRSLAELKTIADSVLSDKYFISFIPEKLNRTATGGTGRKLLLLLLNSNIFGFLVNFLINRAFLGVMPYHVIIYFK